MIAEHPLVTVVMVAYNHKRYLRETVASILAQTMPELEIILVDNGSTDGSAEIISSFEDNRLCCIRQENLGLSLAYNTGIQKARGKWIALSNADDVWMKEKLACQLQALQKQSAGAIFTAAQLIDDDGQPVPDEIAQQFPFSFENLTREKMYEKFFFKTNFMCATSALIDGQLLDGSAFDPALLQLQDFDLWVRLVKTTSLLVLPEKLVGYRIRCDGQNLSLDTRNRARVLFELHCVYRRFFDDVDPEFFTGSFKHHFRKPKPTGSIGLEFEKAFLYLKMHEPSIRVLGLELLYKLFALPEARALAASDYDLRIEQLWDLSRMPVYADSRSMDEAVLSAADLLQQLRNAENERDNLRHTIGRITRSRLWKLRERVQTVLKFSRNLLQPDKTRGN